MFERVKVYRRNSWFVQLYVWAWLQNRAWFEWFLTAFMPMPETEEEKAEENWPKKWLAQVREDERERFEAAVGDMKAMNRCGMRKRLLAIFFIFIPGWVVYKTLSLILAALAVVARPVADLLKKVAGFVADKAKAAGGLVASFVHQHNEGIKTVGRGTWWLTRKTVKLATIAGLLWCFHGVVDHVGRFVMREQEIALSVAEMMIVAAQEAKTNAMYRDKRWVAERETREAQFKKALEVAQAGGNVYGQFDRDIAVSALYEFWREREDQRRELLHENYWAPRIAAETMQRLEVDEAYYASLHERCHTATQGFGWALAVLLVLWLIGRSQRAMTVVQRGRDLVVFDLVMTAVAAVVYAMVVVRERVFDPIVRFATDTGRLVYGWAEDVYRHICPLVYIVDDEQNGR